MERSPAGRLIMTSDDESNKASGSGSTTTLKKGPWTAEEDQKLMDYIGRNGHGSWRALPKEAGLNRCGKSCRLRWTNYLRPDIKRGNFSHDEEKLIIHLHGLVGNKWSTIAGHLPGRTDNEIKNLWNTHLKKKLLQMGIDPLTHRPISTDHLFAYHNYTNNNNSTALPLDKIHVLNNLLFQLLQYNLLLSSSPSSSSSNNESINTINHDYYSSLLEQYYSNCTTTTSNTQDNPPTLFVPPSSSTTNTTLNNNINNIITHNDHTNNTPSSAYPICNINNDHQQQLVPPMLLHNNNNNAQIIPSAKPIINNNNINNNNNNASIIPSFQASPPDDVEDSSYWNHIIMDLASTQSNMENIIQ